MAKPLFARYPVHRQRLKIVHKMRHFSRSGTYYRAAATSATLLALAAAPLSAAPDQGGWTTYRSAIAGLIFEYPAAIFTVQQGDPTDALQKRTANRAGRIFTTADGRAVLQIGTVPNLDGASVDALRKLAIATSYRDVKLDYNRTASTWYAVSGTRGAETVYERVHFSCGGRRLDIWAVTYPTIEHRLFDALVEDISRRFRPIIANIRCS